MIKINVEKTRLAELIDVTVKKTMQMDLGWNWPCGVAYYGVSAALAAEGNEEYLRLLKTRVDEHIAVGLPQWNVNACAMGHCLLTLHEFTDDDKYFELVMSKVKYLREEALRFGDGVLQHTVSSKNDFPEQAWADTLFMAAYFLLRVGVKLGDKAIIDDALNQYYWHIEYLQDPATGLWYHGYDNIRKNHMSGFFWARANAWAAYTMSRVKVVLPEPYLYPQYMDIDCSLRDQLQGLKALQTENGLWRTVLNEDSYEELSACCGITAGMIANGYRLHTDAANAALAGIIANISDDGRLLNVSGGTAVMRDLDGYRNISRKWTQGWGQGLALAALVTALGRGDGMESH
jgi:unsaturated rhamnogalacturonyl hydrolase